MEKVKKTQEEDVFEIQSHSNPNTWYIVNLKTGTCSCPAWKFRYARVGAKCKHYKDLIDYFSDLKGNRQHIIDEILEIVRNTPYIGTEELSNKYGDSIIEEMVNLGMLYEQRGKLLILE